MNNTTKIGTVPGAIREFLLEDNTTVGQALEMAGLTATGFDIRVDGVAATVDTVVVEGTKLIVLAKQIKGNSDEVVLKVGVVPGAINEFAVEEGTSVAEVLELAGLSAAGYDIRLDGAVVTGDDLIEEDSQLLVLAKQIKGN